MKLNAVEIKANEKYKYLIPFSSKKRIEVDIVVTHVNNFKSTIDFEIIGEIPEDLPRKWGAGFTTFNNNLIKE